MPTNLTEQAKAEPEGSSDQGDTSFEIVYQIEAKRAAKAYKRFVWQRASRTILIAASVAIGSLVAYFIWEPSIILILGSAYPAAYVIMWVAQLGHIDEGYEALEGRKLRMLIDSGGISSYFGNTFKRVQWLGVTRIVLIGDYYFIYFERDALPTGGFPKSEISAEALEFVRQRTTVVE